MSNDSDVLWGGMPGVPQ